MAAMSTSMFGSSSTRWYPSPCVSSVVMLQRYDVVWILAKAASALWWDFPGAISRCVGWLLTQPRCDMEPEDLR